MGGTCPLGQLKTLLVVSIAKWPVPLGEYEGVQPLVLQSERLKASKGLMPESTLLEATFPMGHPKPTALHFVFMYSGLHRTDGDVWPVQIPQRVSAYGAEAAWFWTPSPSFFH